MVVIVHNLHISRNVRVYFVKGSITVITIVPFVQVQKNKKAKAFKSSSMRQIGV
jgi:hypothetical protein